MISYQAVLDHDEKVKRSIEQMKLAAQMSKRYYGKPILICYSGGKDSDALLGIAALAGIDYEVMHSLTTVDAPETVKHVRQTFARLEADGVHCEIRRPEFKGKPVTMWTLIPEKKMPPTRVVRYCCRVLKETGGAGRAIATGVRRSESNKRQGRKFAMKISETSRAQIDFEDAASLFNEADSFIEHDNEFLKTCKVRGKTSFQPLLEWTSNDVWQFIDERGISYNPLYDEGWKRIGCVGCPMAGKTRVKEFARWPKYEVAYKRAFGKMLEVRKRCGLETQWNEPDEVFRWWMEDNE